MATIEVLSTVKGHTEIYFKDVALAERAKLAETVKQLLREGHALFLIRGMNTHRIKGYDESSNEWLVLSDEKPQPEPIRMRNTARSRVTAVAPTAGG